MITQLEVFPVRLLKELLMELGQKTTGTKNQLIRRLLESQKIETLLDKLNKMADTEDKPKNEHESENESNKENESENDEKNNDNESENEEKEKEKNTENDIENEDKGKNNESENDSENENVQKDRKMKSSEEENLKIEFSLMQRELKLMKREMEVQKREMELLNKENINFKNADKTNNTNFTSVKDLISEFYGNGDNVVLWISQLNNIRNVYKLDDNNLRALIANKLKDRALKWLHSYPNLMVSPIDELIIDIQSMFKDRTSHLVLKRQFETRQWREGETFDSYFHDKVILANKALIFGESVLLEYVIEGIPDFALRSQAQMQCFENKNQLLKAFSCISLPKSKADRQVIIQGTKSKEVRCFNCNSFGHMATECRKSKREAGSCFVCGEMGHLAAACSKRKPIHTLQSQNQDQFVRQIYCILLKNNQNYKILLGTLIDTGSPISFIRQK